jgi:pantoate--beta-alanine ligase
MPQHPPIVRTVKDLRAHVTKWRQAGETVALVPTMGAIHAGHLSLVGIAKAQADRVVVSIFVNPSQFGPREDFETYPSNEAADIETLGEAGAQLIYVPSVEELYPPGSATRVSVPDLTEDLCGAARPQHFEGVATVVTTLLLQCAPDIVLFGEKDYQQLLMIERLVRDLSIPVRVVSGPTLREGDGLALSSRNANLSPEQRQIAPLLYQVISAVAADLAEGSGADDAALAGRLKLEAEGFRVDYVAVRDPETLVPLSGPLKGRARVLAAVHLGATRLIDNVPAAPRSKTKGN